MKTIHPVFRVFRRTVSLKVNNLKERSDQTTSGLYQFGNNRVAISFFSLRTTLSLTKLHRHFLHEVNITRAEVFHFATLFTKNERPNNTDLNFPARISSVDDRSKVDARRIWKDFCGKWEHPNVIIVIITFSFDGLGDPRGQRPEIQIGCLRAGRFPRVIFKVFSYLICRRRRSKCRRR